MGDLLERRVKLLLSMRDDKTLSLWAKDYWRYKYEEILAIQILKKVEYLDKKGWKITQDGYYE